MTKSAVLVITLVSLAPPPALPDLALTSFSDTPDPVYVGSRISYQLVLQNLGNVTANNVAVVDTLSAGATFVSCTATRSGVCTISNEGAPVAVVAYDRLGAHITSTITLVAEVSPTLAPGTTVRSSARASHNGADKNPGNNAISATTGTRSPANPSMDVGLQMAVSPPQVLAGNLLTYTIDVANAGPSAATGVVVTDTLPAATSFASCTSTAAGVCGGSGNRRTVRFETLGVGASAKITLKASVNAATPAGTEISNTARVAAAAPRDDTPGNERASAKSTVVTHVAPFVMGQWGARQEWPMLAIHAHVLPTGRVLAFTENRATFWDPATAQFTTAPLPPANIFCSGHAFLPDGRLLVAGGHIAEDVGIDKSHVFDPLLGKWTEGPRMNAGRWYPTATSLPNGEVLVTSGGIDLTQGRNQLPQVWTAQGTWRSLTGAVRTIDNYPFMHVAPDGRVFFAGPGRQTLYLDTRGAGSWSNGPVTLWGHRDSGTSVLYDEGKVLLLGGGEATITATAEIIDLNAGTVRYTNPMAFPRRHLNATLLPDGKVLVTGGTSTAGFNNAVGSVYPGEIWDPRTERWTTVASATVRRLYHSTAMLLPDARVLSTGGGRPAGAGLNPPDTWHRDGEVYSPPYLFQRDGTPAVRPTIASAPEAVGYREAFIVGTPDAQRIAAVTWLAPSSVTHSVNMTQRMNRLTFTSTTGGLRVTAPASANLAPPGVYILFLLDAQGVPSVGRMIKLR